MMGRYCGDCNQFERNCYLLGGKKIILANFHTSIYI